MIGAPVPKASIDEDSDPGTRENDIGSNPHVAAADGIVRAEPQPGTV